ncbi:MAG: hypothetical protein ACFB0F_13985 [Neomegalonema sp.]
MSQFQLLISIWAVAFGLTIASLAALYRGGAIRTAFERGALSGALLTVTIALFLAWFASTVAATFIDDQILEIALGDKFALGKISGFIAIPILLGLFFAALIRASESLLLMLALAFGLAVIDLFDMASRLEVLRLAFLETMAEGGGYGEEARIYQDYYFERPHLERIAVYLAALLLAGLFAALSFNAPGLGDWVEHIGLPGLASRAAASGRSLRLIARLIILLAITLNLAVLWSWRLDRSDALETAGFSPYPVLGRNAPSIDTIE